MQDKSRDKARTRQGQAGTSRDKVGTKEKLRNQQRQAGTTRASQGQAGTKKTPCPSLSLPGPAPDGFFIFPVCPHLFHASPHHEGPITTNWELYGSCGTHLDRLGLVNGIHLNKYGPILTKKFPFVAIGKSSNIVGLIQAFFGFRDTFLKTKN